MSHNFKPSPELPHRAKANGLQEFILDPKTSVKKYLEGNNSQQANSQLGSIARPDFAQPEFTHNVTSANRTSASPGMQTYQPYQADPQPQRPQQPQTHQYAGSTAPFANSTSPPPGYGGVPAPDQRFVGPAPPPAEPLGNNMMVHAPRRYHRMITEYETIKAVFYAANFQPTSNDLSPLASRLKYLTREIWNLRYTCAAEFPYNDATTEERITEWKAQFEYWSDVLEDLLDPRYVARAKLEARESDWAGVAGLSSGAAAKNASSAADDDEEAAPVVVKKKSTKTAAAAEGDPAPAPKKKVVKKKAVAAE